MKRIKTLTFLLMIILSVGVSAQNPRSVFTDRPVDEAAIYFTPENFKVKADGRMDVSEALQEALNRTKQKENGCGILFIPEGVYKLNKTIYIPSGVRIIGYGGKRPVFVLAKQAPGFQEVTRETAKGKYLFWFIGGGKEYIFRLLLIEEAAYSNSVEQIEFFVGLADEIGVSFLLKIFPDGRTYQSPVACYIYFGIFV